MKTLFTPVLLGPFWGGGGNYSTVTMPGSIPSAMGNMAALKEICLNNNELSGK